MSSSAWFPNGAGTACTKHLLGLSRRQGDGADPEIRVLETFPCPLTGPFKVRARSHLGCVQLCDGLGGGAEQSTSLPRDPDVVATPRAFRRRVAPWRGVEAERERVSNPREGCLALLAMDLCGALWRTGMPRQEVPFGFAFAAPVRRRAHPLSSLHRQKAFRIEGPVAQQHVVDGPPEPGGQNPQSLLLSVLLLEPREVLASRCVPAQEQTRSFGEGPLEMDISHLGAGELDDLAIGLMPTPDQAGVGQEALDTLKPAQVVDLVEQGHGQDLADSRNGAKQKVALSVVVADLVEQVELELSDDLIVGLQEGDVGGHRHLDAGLVEVLDDGAAILGLVDPLLEVREVVLGVGVLDVSEELGALPDEEGASPHEVACGPLLVGIEVAVGEIAAAQQGGDLEGIDAVVLRLPCMDGLHVECVAEDELDAFLFAEVGDPVPAEDALDGDDEVPAVGLEGLEELVGVAGELLVDERAAIFVKNADIHGAGVEVNSAVMSMLLGVESHRGLLSRLSKPPAYRSRRPEGASNRIPGHQAGG
jgi:hypothetical protein